MTSWPDVVWSAPALRDLDARARREIAAAGVLRRLRHAEAAYRAGDPAVALFAVVDGAVEVRGAGAVRTVRGGETFGEEAFVAEGIAHRGDARATERTTLATIPGPLLRRVLERGASRASERVARAMLRAAARERLRASRLGGECQEGDLDLLLDAIEHTHARRGEPIACGAGRVLVVASGLVRLERRADGATERAYLGVGEIVEERPGDVATAAGPTWLLGIAADAVRDARARAPRLLEAARSTRDEKLSAGRSIDARARGRGSVLEDLHRLETARSLLVLDQEACVRCGHCAWSCASAHDDGVARLTRVGEVVVARTADHATPRALLLATSCQHCEAPACLPACPTGAIAFGARGDVQVREDLCTGCGACAKACPWDAVQMVERAGGSVAVKCDLCRGVSGGPACVEACPTEALQRVEPTRALPDVGIALGVPEAPVSPRRAVPAWPFLAVGAALALAVGRGPTTAWGSGAVAGGALLVLAAHGVWKRLVRRFGRAAYLVHASVAPVALAAVAHHVSGRVPPNAGGALLLATLVALTSGGVGWLAYLVVPRCLARLETAGALPEDLPARLAEIEAQTFAELTGRPERVKAIYAHLVRPYVKAWWGSLALVVRGVDVAREELRLRTRITRTLAGRPRPLEGLDALVRLAVAARATAAQRWLHRVLRAWLPLHVVAAAVALAMLAAHVLVVTVFR